MIEYQCLHLKKWSYDFEKVVTLVEIFPMHGIRLGPDFRRIEASVTNRGLLMLTAYGPNWTIITEWYGEKPPTKKEYEDFLLKCEDK